MAIGQIGFTPLLAQTTSTAAKSEEEKRQQERELAEKNVKAAQEAFAKRIELAVLKAQNQAVMENLKTQEEDAEKAYREFLKTKNSKGAATVDSGQKGVMRWLSNAGTAIVNIGKSFIGYDKNGNWDPVKCVTNVGITALAIGATFIPYVGPVIGYGLLATGVVGGVIGAAKGMSKLEAAERSGDQQKIDEAQQDICGNAFIGITSACGLRGAGKAFRTSSATTEMASSATARTSMGGKCVESVSNFGRDITVNAFKATKHSTLSGKIPNLSGLKSWDKQYNKKLNQYEQNLNNEIQNVDNLISGTTDSEELALLFEKRALLVKNKLEFDKYVSLKSKSDIDKLVAPQTKTAAQENLERLGSYTESGGNITLPGGTVSAKQFAIFQKRMTNLQNAYDRSFKDLIKAKENMMRNFARKPDKHRAALDEYISTIDAKRSLFKPSTWVKSKEQIAIGGKNTSYAGKAFGTVLTHPASNIAKASGAWIAPIHSGAMLFTMELSPEETQAQIESMETAIQGIKTLREKMENAQTAEDFNSAITEYNQLVAAANGEQPAEQTQDSEEIDDNN